MATMTERRAAVLHALTALAALLLFASCDSREDDALLNPPPPDSTRVRVLNLVDGSVVTASLGSIRVVTDLQPMSSSEVLPVFSSDQVVFSVRRASSGRTDSLPGQILARGARLTYITMRRGDSGTTTLSLPLGRQDLTDLSARSASVVTFVNAVDDTSFLGLRLGCQSGDTLADGIGFGRTTSLESKAGERSLFVLRTGDSIPLASTRLSTPPGSVTYLIATREGGAFRLFAVPADGTAGGRLPTAPPETRTTATVSLLNANADGATISASIDGGATVAVGLGPLDVSGRVEVDACVGASGDRLVVSGSGGDTTSARLRLTVGADAMVAVYDRVAAIKAIVLDREYPSPRAGYAFVRCANLSPSAGTASVAVGSGSPDTVVVEGRPFGSLRVGAQSNYVPFRVGDYPFLLDRSADGAFLFGGIESLTEGYYTLVVVERGGAPRLMIIRDDATAPDISELKVSGIRLSLFNAIAGKQISFGVGALSIPSIAYSYVSRTLMDGTLSSITSSVGSVPINTANGAHTVVAARIDGRDRLFAFPVNQVDPPDKSAQVRVFSTISEELEIREDDVRGSVLDIVQSGRIGESRDVAERRYSFFAVRPDGTLLAQSSGVTLVAGRRYLMVIADSGAGSDPPYSIIWMQE